MLKLVDREINDRTHPGDNCYWIEAVPGDEVAHMTNSMDPEKVFLREYV